MWEVAAGAAGGAALGGIGQAIGYGLNAMAASKAHDRNKNMLTRRHQYERIALREADINEAYMFARPGGGTPAPMRAPQAAGTPGGSSRFDPLTFLHARQVQAQTDKTKAETDLVKTNTGRARFELDQFKANPELFTKPLEVAGLPRTDAQVIIEGMKGIFGNLDTPGGQLDPADVGMLGLGGLLAAGKFKGAGQVLVNFMKHHGAKFIPGPAKLASIIAGAAVAYGIYETQDEAEAAVAAEDEPKRAPIDKTTDAVNALRQTQHTAPGANPNRRLRRRGRN